MRNYFIAVALAMFIAAGAQNFRGTAVYESKTILDIDVSRDGTNSPGLDDEMKQMLTKAFEKTYILQFDRTSSLYQEQEKLASPAGPSMVMDVKMPGDGLHYKDIRNKSYIVETDVFDKAFLIVDSLPDYNWKVSGETKKIGAYTCYKATSEARPNKNADAGSEKAVNILGVNEKGKVVTAWYTPDIPVSHGPANYWGLPGLILEVNDGNTALLCSKIIINPKEKTEITAPKKGEKVTRARFDEILHKKSEEMQDMHKSDGDGVKIIRIGG